MVKIVGEKPMGSYSNPPWQFQVREAGQGGLVELVPRTVSSAGTRKLWAGWANAANFLAFYQGDFGPTKWMRKSEKALKMALS